MAGSKAGHAVDPQMRPSCSRRWLALGPMHARSRPLGPMHAITAFAHLTNDEVDRNELGLRPRLIKSSIKYYELIINRSLFFRKS